LKRPHVLRQARTAEREARFHVVRGQVQLLVAAEDVHDLMAVNLEALTKIADLVGEADLQRVPGIARILDHLRRANARGDEGCLDARIERFGRGGV
jgi:hypothetical protein